MEFFLRHRLPEKTWENRLESYNDMCFLQFNAMDVERLARLDIEVDDLGPRIVVCMWDNESPLEIGGYLVVDNLAMGRPSMGGIRMLPDITPSQIYNLARGMTLKNAAADLPYGGGKSGIVSSKLSPDQHEKVIKGFARLLFRYHDIYLPGPDVGTCDADMKTIAVENGLDAVVSKPVEMGGNRIDDLGAAAGSTVIALQALLEEMPKLKSLEQFQSLEIPKNEELTILIQGFGAVGAHAARIINKRLPGARITGISDIQGYLFDENGLPVDILFQVWAENQIVSRRFFNEKINTNHPEFRSIKYSTDPDDLLRESGFCLIPASPIANYLDVNDESGPCVTTKRMGDWAVIIEGANTYSPVKSRKAARARMERDVYRRKGILIATDYLVNSGGVIYAAQEQLINTPEQLELPDDFRGDKLKVDTWLDEHSEEFEILAEKRRIAAYEYRENVIRKNMREHIEFLTSDSDMLPSESAERISIRRVASRESDRTARELMIPIPKILAENTTQDAAEKILSTGCSILAVVTDDSEIVGVVTDWDITRSTALGNPDNQPLNEVMSKEVVTAHPEDKILEVIRKLEYHEFSALPVVENGIVLGVVTTDILARQSLLRLLQSPVET